MMQLFFQFETGQLFPYNFFCIFELFGSTQESFHEVEL